MGAAVMYVLDPDKGRRRRALVRDKAVRAAHKTGDVIGSRSRDLGNRARGIAAEARSSLDQASRAVRDAGRNRAERPERDRGNV